MSTDYATLGKRMAKGAVWTILMRFTVRFIGFFSTIILARLLVPEDFGLVAIATVFVGLIELMSRFGFTSFLIREQAATRRHYDTVWTLMAVRGAVTAVVLAASAPLMAAFFEDPRLEDVIYVLAVATLVSGVENVAVIDFQKHLDFRKDFQFMVWTKVAGFVATIALAVLMQSYWALVLGTLVNRLAATILSFAMHPFRPKPCLTGTREIFNFSRWLLANNILFFIQRRCDVAAVGKLAGTASLGIYSVAYEISTLVVTELAVPVHRVLFPGLSKLAGNDEQMRRAFLEGLAATAMLGAPLAVGLGLTADPLIRLVLGSKWLDAIPIIQILVITCLLRVLMFGTSAFFMARNQSHLTTIVALTGAVFGVPLVLVGAWHGQAIGVAWGVNATSALLFLVNLALLWTRCEVNPLAIVSGTWRTFASCVVTAGAVGFVMGRIPDFAGPFVELFCSSLAGATVYVASHLALWRACGSPDGTERYAFAALKALRARLQPRRAD